MVINNRICRANLAYNVTLYKVTANKTHTVCRGGRYYEYKHEDMFIFKDSLSLPTPYTQNLVFLSNTW